MASTTASTMVATVNNDALSILSSIPSNFSSDEFVYLLKPLGTAINTANFHQHVQSGSILGQYFLKLYTLVVAQTCQLTPWRNGSASDSRSEGCVFESRRGQTFFG